MLWYMSWTRLFSFSISVRRVVPSLVGGGFADISGDGEVGDIGGENGQRSLEIGIDEMVAGEAVGLGVSGVMSCEIDSRELVFGDTGGEIGLRGSVVMDAIPGKAILEVVTGGVVGREKTGARRGETGVEGAI